MRNSLNFLNLRQHLGNLFQKTSLSRITVIICFVVLILPSSLFAQKDDDPMFAVYTYEIKPEKVKAEEAFVKEIIAKLKEHGVEGPTWSTATTNDNRFMYIMPIKNMAQLDEQPWQPLIDKMGKENWKKFTDKARDHESFNSSSVSVLDSELSYMPNGIDPNTVGEDFRSWNIFHIKPGMYDKAKELAKQIKEVYAEKKSDFYYRIYHYKFGGNSNTMVVVSSHENMGDYYQNSVTARELIMGDVESIYDEFLTCVAKQERIYGEIRPELSNQGN